MPSGILPSGFLKDSWRILQGILEDSWRSPQRILKESLRSPTGFKLIIPYLRNPQENEYPSVFCSCFAHPLCTGAWVSTVFVLALSCLLFFVVAK